MLNPRLEIWQSGTELQEALNLWLESLEARGVAPCTRDGVKEFVAFLEQHATTLDQVANPQAAQGRFALPCAQRLSAPAPVLVVVYAEGTHHQRPVHKVQKPRVPPKVKPALTPDEVEQIARCALRFGDT
jgi:hypothetical protein